MAVYLGAKFPGDVLPCGWEVPVADGDSVASYTIELASGTVVLESDSLDCNTVTFYVSGGAAGETCSFEATATTNDGTVYSETIYLPVTTEANALGYTVRDVCNFAVRKVFGAGQTPPAKALTDAMERLSDMLASWAGQGADLGVPLPLTAAQVLYIPDAQASAVKANLILEVSDLYGFELSPRTVENARRGLQLIKAAKLPDDRGQAEYY